MSYSVKRSLGFQRWGVTNPWVFANLAQPQRQRGSVSKYVFKTTVPRGDQNPLGQLTIPAIVSDAEQRSIRMERYALAGLGLSAVSASVAIVMFLRSQKKAA